MTWASLAALLRCPACGLPLAGDGPLTCSHGHRYDVADGIPVLLRADLLDADPQYRRQRDYFDSEFARYHEYRLEQWRVGYLRRLAAADALGGDGEPLVDVGVGGSGYTVIEAARAGRPAIGCDLSLEGLRVAKQFAESEGVADRVLFVCCSAEALPFASHSFDVGLAIAVLEHVPDDGALLDELARVLRPGGRAWVTVPHELRSFSPLLWPPNLIHDRRLGHLRRYGARQLAEAGRRRGLEPVEVQFTGHAVKLLQIVIAPRLPERLGERFWWWCERRDLERSRRRRGAMQLSVVFRRGEAPPGGAPPPSEPSS
jgi:SAM-dependent methyltransferase